MQVWKYASMKFTRLLVCKYASIQVYKFAGEGTQVWKFSSMQVSKQFPGIFKGVLWMFQMFLHEDSIVFQDSCWGVQRKFKGD